MDIGSCGVTGGAGWRGGGGLRGRRHEGVHSTQLPHGGVVRPDERVHLGEAEEWGAALDAVEGAVAVVGAGQHGGGEAVERGGDRAMNEDPEEEREDNDGGCKDAARDVAEARVWEGDGGLCAGEDERKHETFGGGVGPCGHDGGCAGVLELCGLPAALTLQLWKVDVVECRLHDRVGDGTHCQVRNTVVHERSEDDVVEDGLLPPAVRHHVRVGVGERVAKEERDAAIGVLVAVKDAQHPRAVHAEVHKVIDGRARRQGESFVHEAGGQVQRQEVGQHRTDTPRCAEIHTRESTSDVLADQSEDGNGVRVLQDDEGDVAGGGGPLARYPKRTFEEAGAAVDVVRGLHNVVQRTVAGKGVCGLIRLDTVHARDGFELCVRAERKGGEKGVRVVGCEDGAQCRERLLRLHRGGVVRLQCEEDGGHVVRHAHLLVNFFSDDVNAEVVHCAPRLEQRCRDARLHDGGRAHSHDREHSEEDNRPQDVHPAQEVAPHCTPRRAAGTVAVGDRRGWRSIRDEGLHCAAGSGLRRGGIGRRSSCFVLIVGEW
ncbi:hypothetical protein NESM_000915100 [Novymonas esmeraldas]|uniref:Uncharacterized protein n=1 Tax=Novymonas esmeraldas TaxID=1808958 RepID=A0AAW0F2W6_9TRYP